MTFKSAAQTKNDIACSQLYAVWQDAPLSLLMPATG